MSYWSNVGKFWRGVRWLWTRDITDQLVLLPEGVVSLNEYRPGWGIEYKPGWGPWRFLLVYILDYGTRVHTGGAVVSWSRWWWERRQKYGHANLLSRLLNHLDENHGARAGGALWGTEDTGWALVGGLVFWAGLLALVGWLLWRWLA